MSGKLSWFLIFLLVSMLFLSVSCAGSGLSNGIFRGKYATYRVGILSDSWNDFSVKDNDISFSSSKGYGTIAANSTCAGQYEDVPLSVLGNHLMFGMTKRQIQLEESVTMSGREGQHVVAKCELDGVVIMFEVFVVKRDHCIYDLQYIAPPQNFSSGRADFHAFVNAFKVLGRDD